MADARIITVGLGGCWDVTCTGRGLRWGQHAVIDAQTCRPAGKALNVCRALAWLGVPSVAAGVWGAADHDSMAQELAAWPRLGKSEKRPVRLAMTTVPGQTRTNVTVVDAQASKEMHLRAPNTLISKKALAALQRDLRKLVKTGDICVFAGSMPAGEYLGEIKGLLATCREAGGRVVLDTSGAALTELVDAGGLWAIKPNVEELRQLLGSDVADTPAALTRAARELLGQTEVVLVSRGGKGALVVNKRQALAGKSLTRRKVHHTVACGDYFLAGFLSRYGRGGGLATALTTALKTGTLRAWGQTEPAPWRTVSKMVEVEITSLRSR